MNVVKGFAFLAMKVTFAIRECLVKIKNSMECLTLSDEEKFGKIKFIPKGQVTSGLFKNKKTKDLSGESYYYKGKLVPYRLDDSEACPKCDSLLISPLRLGENGEHICECKMCGYIGRTGMYSLVMKFPVIYAMTKGRNPF